MKVTAVVTPVVRAGKAPALEALVDAALERVPDGSVVVVTSKVAGLCEGRAVSTDVADKQQLAKREADFHLSPTESKYGITLTINRNLIVRDAGIDESNGGGYYVLWPADPFATARRLRDHLVEREGLTRCGVVISDSTTLPLRRGAVGAALAYSGFAPVNSYRGRVDLFGREFGSRHGASGADIATSLASAAVLVMGEGDECTPIALVEDVPFVEFVDVDDPPAPSDWRRIEDDLFAPLLTAVDWQTGP